MTIGTASFGDYAGAPVLLQVMSTVEGALTQASAKASSPDGTEADKARAGDLLKRLEFMKEMYNGLLDIQTWRSLTGIMGAKMLRRQLDRLA